MVCFYFGVEFDFRVEFKFDLDRIEMLAIRNRYHNKFKEENKNPIQSQISNYFFNQYIYNAIKSKQLNTAQQLRARY